MLKRFLKLTITLIFCVLTVPTAFAVPVDESGVVVDIDHHLLPFWQSGYMYSPVFEPWECKKYGGPDKGVAEPCRKSSGYFYDSTIGGKGCALTSLVMLFWYHGISLMPDTLQYLDPGRLNDWMVDNNTYDENKGVDWWKTTGKFTVPSIYLWDVLGPNQFLVPNYCCGGGCTSLSFDCFWVEEGSSRFTELLDQDIKDYQPAIMKIKYKDSKNRWHNSHFVVVGGYDAANSEYRDYDPDFYGVSIRAMKQKVFFCSIL